MKFQVYILKSESINKHYVGYTGMELHERLKFHNYKNKGFTGRAEDWEVIYSELCESKELAIQIEKQVKRRGAARYIKDQIKY